MVIDYASVLKFTYNADDPPNRHPKKKSPQRDYVNIQEINI